MQGDRRMDDYRRLLSFLKECLQARPEAAAWDRVDDSQTQILLKHLKSRSSQFSILDYGCGNMRTLNALSVYIPAPRWLYVGYDPNLGHALTKQLKVPTLPNGCKWQPMLRKELLRRRTKFDFVLVENVLHEIGIFETASLFQDCRILLRPSGKLLVLDTPLLPKGEPSFIPVFDWDMPRLFGRSVHLSATSPKGLPLLFHIVPRKRIPYYTAAISLCRRILEAKRTAFSLLASQISVCGSQEILELVHLGLDKMYDYVYLDVVVGNITKRLEEHPYIGAANEVNKLGAKVVDILAAGNVRAHDVFAMLSPNYRYETIDAVLRLMREHWITFRDESHDGSHALLPSEIYDILIDKVGGSEAVKERGLEKCLMEARIRFGDIYPGSPFAL